MGGVLAISGPLSIAAGGTLDVISPLSVGSLSNQGEVEAEINGMVQLTSSGAITNSGSLGTPRLDPNDLSTPIAAKVTLVLAAPSISNTGSMAGVEIDTPAGGFANLQNGTLSGGSYLDITLNVGATLVTDAADLTLSYDPTTYGYEASPADQEYDPASATYVPIESTLRTIAAGGSLTTGYYTTSSLTVDGSLTATGIFNAGQLTIDPGGKASISGTITGSVTDNGVIKIAPFVRYNPVYDTTVLSRTRRARRSN